MEGAKFVWSSCENSVVIRGYVTKGSKASSIDEGINIEAGNTGFFIRSHLDFDVARVASSIDPIDFLSVEGDADGSPGFTR